jgi:hypothetical protein
VFEQYRRVWPLSFALDPGSFHWCSGIQPFQSGYRLLLGRLPSPICALKDSPAYWVKESVCDLVVELEVEACRQRGEFDFLTIIYLNMYMWFYLFVYIHVHMYAYMDIQYTSNKMIAQFRSNTTY